MFKDLIIAILAFFAGDSNEVRVVDDKVEIVHVAPKVPDVVVPVVPPKPVVPKRVLPISTRYNVLFQEYTAKYLPELDWRIVRLQAIQESSLIHTAVSATGAVGLMQIIPSTGRELSTTLWSDTTPDLTNPSTSIEGGTYYMSYLMRKWVRKRSVSERHKLALLSYNVGLKHVLAAQKICGYPVTYARIIPCLGNSAGAKLAAVGKAYVREIYKKYALLKPIPVAAVTPTTPVPDAPTAVIVKVDVPPNIEPLLPRRIRYDILFRRYASKHSPLVDWRLYKAQAMAESNLDPLAVSLVGAKGIMQAMNPTWGDWQRQLWGGRTIDVFDPEYNIEGGIYYMERLRHTWRRNRTEVDRHKLALASYNAGTGHILKSQKLCGDPRPYVDIMECLPQVTGPKNSAETQHYAPRIYRFYATLMVI